MATATSSRCLTLQHAVLLHTPGTHLDTPLLPPLHNHRLPGSVGRPVHDDIRESACGTPRMPCLSTWHLHCMAHQHRRSQSDGAFVGLQSPLQPLQDNLESTTYETFERDGRKYEQYQLAIAAALMDRVPDAEAGATEVTCASESLQCTTGTHRGARASVCAMLGWS